MGCKSPESSSDLGAPIIGILRESLFLSSMLRRIIDRVAKRVAVDGKGKLNVCSSYRRQSMMMAYSLTCLLKESKELMTLIDIETVYRYY